MKQLKPITNFISERRRQDVCSGCGKSIEDSEKECPTCGTFPHKAYHERAAAKTLGISKWLQNSPVMQPNQKLSEETKPENMNNIIKFNEFVESRVTENQSDLDFFAQACMEEGIDELFDNELNEGKIDTDIMTRIKSFIDSITNKVSKGIGQQSVDPKVNGLLVTLTKGIADAMQKAGNNPAEFRKQLAESKQMKTIAEIYANSLQKLLTAVKADPSVLLSKQTGATFSSLFLIRKVAKESIMKQNKDFGEILNKAGNYKSATPTKPAPGKPGAKPASGKPGAKPAPAKPGAKPAPAKPGVKPAEAKPEQPADNVQPAASPAPAASTETPASTEDKKTA